MADHDPRFDYDLDWQTLSLSRHAPELNSYESWDDFVLGRPGLANDRLTANFSDDHTPAEWAVFARGEEWAPFASWNDELEG